MLRSILHASIVDSPSCLLLGPNARLLLRRSTSHEVRRPFCAAAGRVADVLEILAPYRHLFQPSDAKRYVNLLKKCLRSDDHRTIGLLHARLLKLGFEVDLVVSNVLLDMYGKVGNVEACTQLFDEMPERDLVSWCTLMSGYVHRGFSLDALGSFRRMLSAGWKPNHFVISSVLNGCSVSGIIELGYLVHGLAVKAGLEFDRFVEVGLVSMYAKCGKLDDALKVFYQVPVKSVVAWNSIISGHFMNGFLVEAVELCQDMCRIGFVMDIVTLRVVTAAASALELFQICRNLHVYAMKIGLDFDSFVVAELVKFLTKIGEVNYIRELCCKIRRPDAALYALLISAYAIHGQRADAIKLAEEFLTSSSLAKEGALVNVVNLCLHQDEGKQIHAHFLKSGRLGSLWVNNAMISMYCRCGDMVGAKLTFDSMQVHDVVSWTAIMTGLIYRFQFSEAFEHFYAFKRTGLQLDLHATSSIMSACIGLRDVDKGKQIHCLAFKLGFDACDFIHASLLHMYAKCGYISSAVRLFSHMSSPHSCILINIMIAGYICNSQPEKALHLFRREYHLGLIPDQFSYSTVLSACVDVRSIRTGQQIHSCVTKSGFESDIVVGNGIVNLYVKLGHINSASKFFYSMENWNSTSYATLMLGYIEKQGSGEALHLFYQMRQSGLHVSPVSFARILKGCTDTAAVDLGRQIHASVVKMGLVSDIQIENALIGIYGKQQENGMTSKIEHETSVREYVTSDSKSEGLAEVSGGKNLKDLGIFKLEKREAVYHDEHHLNLYAIANFAFEMHHMSLFPHVMQKGSGSSISDDSSKKCRMPQVSPDVFEKVLEREVVLQSFIDDAYVLNRNGKAKLNASSKMGGNVWNHAVIVVFLGKKQLSLLNKVSSL